MLNYVIATYNGNKLEYTLQIQLQILYSLVMQNNLKYLSQITIVCPPTKQKHESFEFYYQKDLWQSLFDKTEIKLVYLDYIGENNTASYDQWLQAYLAYPEFEYYLFIEDDYTIHPSLINFDSQLVEYYEQELGEDKIGYMCSYAAKLHGFPHHAAISNGIMNNKTLKLLGDNILEDYYKLARTTHCQIAFSKLFTQKGMNILDMHNKFTAWFWCSGKSRLINYSDKDDSGNEFMFIPIQYLLSYYFVKSPPSTSTTSNMVSYPRYVIYGKSRYR